MENKIPEYKKPKAEFLRSAAYFKELPEATLDEFCIIGRSNVGKSSFINHVLENNSLARVSKTPGKTSLANLYKINDAFIWVDLPGYGYAKISGGEKVRWSQLIADYCEKRGNLKGALWLIDIRHIGIKADVQAYEWLRELGIPVLPVLTKADKLSSNQRLRSIKDCVGIFSFTTEPVVYSIQEHGSRAFFWKRYEKWRQELKDLVR